jgi:hypothetical protein
MIFAKLDSLSLYISSSRGISSRINISELYLIILGGIFCAELLGILALFAYLVLYRLILYDCSLSNACLISDLMLDGGCIVFGGILWPVI